MKDTVKDKQNLEGILTLTNDPLATYQVAGGGKQQTKPTKRSKKRN